MREFKTYFSDRSIVDELIKIRLRTARKRHDCHFLNNISTATSNSLEAVPSIVDSFLPSRRAWRRPSAAERKGLAKDDVNRLALRRTISGYKSSGMLDTTSWGQRLTGFVKLIQGLIDNNNYELTIPRIQLTNKANSKGLYRPIALYDKLADRVLLGLTARYLRDCFDDDFCDSVYSFRLGENHNHHSAVRNINQYREQYGAKGLFVSECDIKAFFDHVPHNEVREAVKRAVTLATRREVVVNAQALLMIEKYLSSYSFYRTALPRAEELIAKQRLVGAVNYLKPRELRQLGHVEDKPELGIPQGGALSPLLANLVLAHVDKAILAELKSPKLCYARFCDDIILIHPDRAECQDALNRCLMSMKEAKILPHIPTPVTRYDSNYYQSKSKAPYLWSEPKGKKEVVPWISFVGYQIRCDGKLRIRSQSIRKEHNKQIRVVSEVIELLDKNGGKRHLSGDDILRRTQAKLITMAIGRKEQRSAVDSPQQPCWADAFYILNSNVHSRNQLCALDCNRNRQLNRLKRRLLRTGLLLDQSGKKRKRLRKRYYGAPYSYYGFFNNSRSSQVRFTPSSISDYSK